jgi:Leucine-rich repeat (LRR) protein
MYSNQITAIQSGAFAGLSTLKQLDFSSNQISYIESGAFA